MTQTTRWVVLGSLSALAVAGAAAYLWARAAVRKSPSIIHPTPTPEEAPPQRRE